MFYILTITKNVIIFIILSNFMILRLYGRVKFVFDFF